jgi:hypothetical protein
MIFEITVTSCSPNGPLATSKNYPISVCYLDIYHIPLCAYWYSHRLIRRWSEHLSVRNFHYFNAIEAVRRLNAGSAACVIRPVKSWPVLRTTSRRLCFAVNCTCTVYHWLNERQQHTQDISSRTQQGTAEIERKG